MTLQQIKDSLPKYRYLTPGVDKRKMGDQILHSRYIEINGSIEQDWIDIDERYIGEIYGNTFGREHFAVRRRIPDEVIDNQAFWVLYNKLATVEPCGNAYRLQVEKKRGNDTASFSLDWVTHTDGLWKFSQEQVGKANGPKEVFELLGGEQNIIKHLSAGDLYSKWLGEQMA